MEAVIPGDVELCEDCAKLGIQVIECTQKGKKKKLCPTGRFFILKEEVLDRMIEDEKIKESIRVARRMCVDTEVADKIEAAAREASK